MINTGRNRLDSDELDFAPEEQKSETKKFKLEEDFLYGLVTGSDL